MAMVRWKKPVGGEALVALVVLVAHARTPTVAAVALEARMISLSAIRHWPLAVSGRQPTVRIALGNL
jgi:hypothetical protein